MTITQDNKNQHTRKDLDEIDNLPEEVVDEVESIGLQPEAQKKVMAVIMRANSFKGPLPPSEEFERYNSVLPGAAERIMACMEKEQSHRHEMNKSTVDHAYRSERRGQDYAFAVMVMLVIGAIIVTYMGYPWVAGVMFSAAVLGVVKSLVDGRSGKKEEDKE